MANILPGNPGKWIRMERTALHNFHVPLPRKIFNELCDEAARVAQPATALARQAIEEWLRQRRKPTRHHYFLREPTAVELSIHDATGALVRRLNGTQRAGLNRVVWDLEEAACENTSGTGRRGRNEGGNGVRVVPGEYKVRMTVAGQTAEESFTVRLDPRVTANQSDLA
jgi:hypothetical protein